MKLDNDKVKLLYVDTSARPYREAHSAWVQKTHMFRDAHVDALHQSPLLADLCERGSMFGHSPLGAALVKQMLTYPDTPITVFCVTTDGFGNLTPADSLPVCVGDPPPRAPLSVTEMAFTTAVTERRLRHLRLSRDT